MELNENVLVFSSKTIKENNGQKLKKITDYYGSRLITTLRVMDFNQEDERTNACLKTIDNKFIRLSTSYDKKGRVLKVTVN